MSDRDESSFHVGLTPGAVVDAAVALTRESHLMSWSIRVLAKRLGVAPSVVYHHVGGKDQLCRRVVERVLGDIEIPGAHPTWQEAFRSVLLTAGPQIARYPGVAKWMLMHGPTIPAAVPSMEQGLGLLLDAGFGEHAATAMAMLFNNAMLSISMMDDRMQHEGDGPRDHATMMAEFRRIEFSSRLRDAMGGQLIEPLAAGGTATDRVRWAYYETVVHTTIAGLERFQAEGWPVLSGAAQAGGDSAH